MRAQDDTQMEIEDFMSVKKGSSGDSDNSIPYMNQECKSPRPLPIPLVNDLFSPQKREKIQTTPQHCTRHKLHHPKKQRDTMFSDFIFQCKSN